MTISPALQAYWDQERRLITDNIRRFGTHLTYVSDELGTDGDGTCACCAAGVGADAEEYAVDGLADLVARTGGDPTLLPPRIHVPFCYTTGLFGVGHAELVVVGLDRSLSARMLNEAAHRVLSHGHELTPGEETELAGRHVLAEEVRHSGLVLLEAHNYFERPPWVPMAACQLTWADEQGRFPWDEGHRSGRWSQPRPGAYRA
ncbi:MAG: DUF4262 domain-containing protein [Arsenicicoccus sp.]|uniref:DUF4262 domain-containing protein n=1 Tax=Serinicoccus profundi TaxID=1078471 RepID=UPI000255E7CF|nr:DUF4262 domain-containing protein [Serinicoccus profundi]PZU46798.1 MAG: DUF4262 domain-containing protein [Arsenicicoccus sp.]